MASARRQRRPQGHPAKIAERRERRGKPPTTSRQAGLRRVVREACQQAATLETAFDAELWASEILGLWWHGGFEAEVEEVERRLGVPFVAELARIGDRAALAGLIALAHVSETELGAFASHHAEQLAAAGVERPRWAEAIERADILRAAVMREEIFDDGLTVWLEAAHDGGQVRALGVYIDHNLGTMAKDILVAESLDQVERIVRDKPLDDGKLIFEPMEVIEAGARIRNALELTELTLDPPVSEDFVSLRALAQLWIDEIPFAEVDAGPNVDQDERERMHADFLSADEASGFASESDEADVVRTAIDFCANYVDGRPLRWSPVVVELFMTDWLPRKVIADADYFEAVPAALEAWIRYAGDRREIPRWAIDRTLEAVAHYTDEMLEAASGGRARGLAGDFIAAAQEAGVDLTDDRAVATFVAGWNARSERA